MPKPFSMKRATAKTSRIVSALEKDQIQRHGDLASLHSGSASSSSICSFRTACSSVSVASSLMEARNDDSTKSSSRMFPTRHVPSALLRAPGPPSSSRTATIPFPQYRAVISSDDQHFLEGLLVLAPDSMDTLGDIM